MSWSRLAPLAIAVVVLAGCGFQPLYGGGERNPTVTELNLIEIAPIPYTAGQALRNSLIDRISTDPTGLPALYVLDVSLEQSRSALAIQFDDSITRYNLTMTAEFHLTERSTNQVIYSNTTRSVGSYNVVDSEYATLASQQDAERRAARVISEEITTMLSVFFARRVGEAG